MLDKKIDVTLQQYIWNLITKNKNMLDKKIDVTLQQYIWNLITKNKNIFQKNAYLQENKIT